ncbi:MAG: penicillin-binding transpeptidase domain-containing protein [Candidatus Curtissbacteria bacterium]|nr:penicillin-binding transpeptidase domain-containing protein [Candidatus Curtissbacteria bacterium]
MKKRKLSPLISDSIYKSGARSKIFKKSFEEQFFGVEHLGEVPKERLSFIKFVAVFVLAIGLVRLFYLTIIQGATNLALAEENRVRLVDMEAPRGRILARDGSVLAESKRTYYLENGDKKTQISREQVEALSKEGLAGEDFSGPLGKIVAKVERVYPSGIFASHVTGYVSPVNEEDVKADNSLAAFESFGRDGIEETYDAVLRGENGKKLVEVDSSHKKISILGEEDALVGQDVNLTVDAALQKKSYEALSAGVEKAKAKSGALIVTNPQNGEILSLVSFPSYDPADIGKALVSDDLPLFNRAIGGNYPPGSVFKIATAIAGLASGKIDKDTQIEDVGQFSLGGETFSNWYYNTYGQKDGIIKLDRAIARSNDIYFYRLGERTGLEEMRRWILKLGFGRKSGVDLPGEAFGVVPDELWKKANIGEGWYLGDTMHLAIGQGFMVTTPLQVNAMTAYVANGQNIIKPHLASKIVSSEGKVLEVAAGDGEKVELPGEYLDVIRQGMRQACQEKGTAYPFFNAPYSVACKTGTAEKFQGNPHAWFTAYAPFEAPKVAITVIIENGGEGSSAAAPVAREVLDWYFSRR